MKKFIVYIGLNDRVTKCQEVSTLDAFKICSNLACEFVGYSTITESRGVYTHANGQIVEEVTLRCEFCDCELSKVKAFAVAAKSALNQESIALEECDINFNFI